METYAIKILLIESCFMLVNSFIMHIGFFFNTKFNIVCRFRNVINSPIVLTDDDDDDDYKNLDTSMNTFRENGNKLKPDSGECTRIVKHFVPSADRYDYI